ncbi:MAG: hypothetical protein JO333_16570 [Verrucomicrobia bacterium]|nr:hypothetical protein [Verrucomicrobiota bacterium]
MNSDSEIRYHGSTLSGSTQNTQSDSLLGNRSQLDGLVINIELTITSIIQGVALSFLCAAATASLSHGRIEDLPYIINGGLLILLFWSRCIGHALTLIRWPLDFTHNFFYFGAAFLEAISFGQIGNPAAWYCVLMVFALVVWLLFILDQRLMNQRAAASANGKSKQLFQLLNRDQKLNIGLFVPGFVLFHGAAAWVSFALSSAWPAAHFVFVAAQFILFAAYLVRFVTLMRQVFCLMEP